MGFAVNYELDLLKKSGKVSNTQIVTFKKGAMQFLVSLCRYSLDKCPLKSLFTRCMRCLSPSSLAESPEAARIMFEKILKKLVEYHTINAGHTDASKQQYNKFLLIVKNNREEFLNFDKVEQRLDEFYWKYMRGGGGGGWGVSLTNCVIYLKYCWFSLTDKHKTKEGSVQILRYLVNIYILKAWLPKGL